MFVEGKEKISPSSRLGLVFALASLAGWLDSLLPDGYDILIQEEKR